MIQPSINRAISRELGLKEWQTDNAVTLLDGGATIPFISRYRKEKTGSLDEVLLTQIRNLLEQRRELEKRRKYILKTIEDQGQLTKELKIEIENAEDIAILEDLYLPFKPKRRSRATQAREKGLEPLARIIYLQDNQDPAKLSQRFIDPDKDVNNVEEALQGVRDIMAEWISEDLRVRKILRNLFYREGILTSKLIKGKEQEGAKFRDYYDFQEPVRKIPSHRILALRRGEKEKFLSLDIHPDEIQVLDRLDRQLIRSRNPAAEQVRLAIRDSYKRLLKPSLETEIRMQTKQNADEEAISVFADNLRQLLLAPPLGRKRVMAIDPGFRTGCKVVCLDEQGKLLHHTSIFPNEPQNKKVESEKVLLKLSAEYRVDAIAIGNGTASRETESFVRGLALPEGIITVIVNESGASIYSASDTARKEFPEHDVTVRGAVSIGRRLMDPLAELVKIEPRSIGVGQYQHDVDQSALKKSLDDVVVSCVNAVGVELNTASKEILTYVSGLGPQLAENIFHYRQKNGPFKTRESLKEVPRMGDKAFEQCAGFLRIRDGINSLDRSAVHPERYDLVSAMAGDLGCTINDLLNDEELRNKIRLSDYVSSDVGLPTLEDILDEMKKPGRDPRTSFVTFKFAEGVKDVRDLKTGMTLPGIITNITRFGAFVDIGVHQDGLVHISQLADRFVSEPSEVVKINQQVTVKVIEVDIDRNRISLSMKTEKTVSGKKPGKSGTKKSEGPDEGDMQSKIEKLKGRFMMIITGSPVSWEGYKTVKNCYCMMCGVLSSIRARAYSSPAAPG
jgi:uncharacterized protein